ncbi:M1 family metallopeptidase [Jatrophihabitans fulvus]
MRTSRLAVLAACALLTVSLAQGSAGARAAAPAPGGSSAGDPYFPRQGNTGYGVYTYDLAFTYRQNPKRIKGRAVIYARAKQSLSRFTLDLRRNMVVSAISVNGAKARWSRPSGNPQDLFVRPARALPANRNFTVIVRYGGRATALRDPNGSLDGMVSTADGVVVVAEPQGAPTWFPVNDTPRDKATYRVSVTAPRGLVAVSNGVFDGVRTGTYFRTWKWRQSQPISSYLATVAIGRFAVRTGKSAGGIPYFNAADPTQRGGLSVLAQTPRVVDYFSRVFGKYPFGATGGIVENANFLGYSLETASRPVYDRAPSIGTLSHELAHQWFGDSVTLERWRDIWLNEGFAQWASWLWDEHRGAMTARQHLYRVLSVPASNTGFWNPPPAAPGGPRTLFAGSVYDRGAACLQALRQKVGNTVFVRILRTWTAAHRHGNARVGQLVAHAEKISGRTLNVFFHEWLYRSGKPRYAYRG